MTLENLVLAGQFIDLLVRLSWTPAKLANN